MSWIGSGPDAASRERLTAEHTNRRLIIANSPPILPRVLGLLRLDDALEGADASLRTPPRLESDGFRRYVS